MLGPKRDSKLVDPLKKVVALTLVPETDEAVTAVKVGEPRTDTIGAEAVPPVVMFVPGCTLVATVEIGAKREPSSLLPLKKVVALILVALKLEAVTAVNVGDPTTDTIGAEAVPPVVMFVPGWTLVATVEMGANSRERFVAPEMKFVAVTSVKDGDATTLTVGANAVPPVVMLVPFWTRVLGPKSNPISVDPL